MSDLLIPNKDNNSKTTNSAIIIDELAAEVYKKLSFSISDAQKSKATQNLADMPKISSVVDVLRIIYCLFYFEIFIFRIWTLLRK